MMIAEPNRHIQHESLQQLLDDSLPTEQTVQFESHLQQCDHCRQQLQSLAGQSQWWEETVGVLSQSTIPANLSSSSVLNRKSQDTDFAVDASLDWIRPLLDPPADLGWGSIDGYLVEGLIGQGGMGVVLKGTDGDLHRPVAIKILSPHLAGMGAARARFTREAQAAAAIVHPSIVPIYSIATTARLPYIVMPCIDGGNLQQRIEREGPLELAEVLRIGLQIAEGLEAAHRQGVIHRDIKPANILIEEGNGRVLISDFGLARVLDDATLTMSGMIAGTPQFMSPEQARGDSVDERSDLFSLGSLLYALSTGRAPFRAESPLAVLRKISETKPRPICEINEQMPVWLDRFIGRFMAPEKERRFANAGQACQCLRDALAHVRNPTSQPLPSWLRQSFSTQKKWMVVTLVAVVIAVATWLITTQLHQVVDVTPRTHPAGSNVDSNLEAESTATSARLESWHGDSIDSEIVDLQTQIESLEQSILPPPNSQSQSSAQSGAILE